MKHAVRWGLLALLAIGCVPQGSGDIGISIPLKSGHQVRRSTFDVQVDFVHFRTEKRDSDHGFLVSESRRDRRI